MCYAETNESSPSTTEEKQTVSEVQLDVSETKSGKITGTLAKSQWGKQQQWDVGTSGPS